MQNNNDVAIVATSHHSFAGGGKNKTRILHELAKLNYDVSYVGIKRPHLFEYIDTKVAINTITPTTVHAFDDNCLFIESAISERITEIAIQKSQYKKVILWGSNLFPFVNAVFLAKLNIMDFAHKNIPMISFPVGSDIWQFGPHHEFAVQRLLYSDLVNCRITYTETFADEIFKRYKNEKELKFEVIPPILDTSIFFYITWDEKQRRKEVFGLPADSIVIIHHSNMRPIKRPQDVMKIVDLASMRTRKKIVLLMLGPSPLSFFDNFPERNWRIIADGKYKIANSRNLTVYLTGIVSNVEDYIRISDISINCSLHDSFNISLMEAMGSGVPCITTNIVGIAPYIQASQGGYMYNINDYDPLKVDQIISNQEGPCNIDYADAVDKLICLIENDKERWKRGVWAAEYFHEHFSPERILVDYQILFNRLIEGAYER